jgi:hypothetical protein
MGIKKGMKTRRKDTKKSKKVEPVSLPELRAGLLYLNSYGHSVVKKATSLREAATKFANECAAVFHKKISIESAMDYLKHAVTYSVSKKTKRKQRGGVADVDYVMRPGAPIPYGQFQNYISKGFFDPQPSSNTLCAAGGVIGSQAGGGAFDTLRQIFTHTPGSNPTTVINDMRTSWAGQQIGPGPDATTSTYKMMTSPSMTNFSRLYSAAQTSKI